jgi:NAD(P)H-dependent FMN reductase
MVTIIAGTNRPGSKTLQVAKLSKSFMDKYKIENQILDLGKLSFAGVDGSQYKENKPPAIQAAVDMLHKSRGYLIVVPEYNGSYPGILKYFIDHWEYPRTFEGVPVAFIGLGGKFGGLRPVEHLQQVMGFRNAFVYPERVFIFNVWDSMRDGQLKDPQALALIEKQALDFGRFVTALEQAKLHAHHRG